MTQTSSNIGGDNEESRKLPISPMKLPKNVKRMYIPISQLEPGYKSTLDFHQAVVAYIDVMGFKTKSNKEDIESTLFDFAGALISPAEKYDSVRFKGFSDCAFLAAPIEKISELISAIRYAFEQWTSDGILIRGGIALGTYTEYRSLFQLPKHFEWNYFFGSAVVEAVECERSGTGSLLYATDACANFLADKMGEPIFCFEEKKIIGWSDNKSVLYRFLAGSLLRLLKLLSDDSYENQNNKRIIQNLMINISYSLKATDETFIWACILSILSLPKLNANARERAIKMLNIKDPSDFERFKPIIDEFLKNEKEISWILTSTNLDSGISGSLT